VVLGVCLMERQSSDIVERGWLYVLIKELVSDNSINTLMTYSRTICGDVRHEGRKIANGSIRYHRIISNTPCIPGRWPGVANADMLAQSIYATMDMAVNALTPNGTITTNVGRGPAFHGQNELKEWQALNADRVNGLEEVPNSAFRVWYGTWIDLHNNDVFVHGRPENHHFKTFRRVGSGVTMNDYTLPDNIGHVEINNVFKSPGCYPIDHSTDPDEGQKWLQERGYNYRLERDSEDFAKFKAVLIEFDHAPGTYIQLPLSQQNNFDDFWDITPKVAETLHKGKGCRHAMGRIEKYANHDIWLYYWMMKVFANPGEQIIIPFAADGELTLAALMNGSTPTTIEMNESRHNINRDVILEWNRSNYS